MKHRTHCNVLPTALGMIYQFGKGFLDILMDLPMDLRRFGYSVRISGEIWHGIGLFVTICSNSELNCKQIILKKCNMPSHVTNSTTTTAFSKGFGDSPLFYPCVA